MSEKPKRDNKIHGIYKKTILETVRKHNVISRTEINKLTDIRLATITAITAELIDEGYLAEIREPNRNKLLGLRTDMFYAISIDIQPERLMTALIDINYNIIDETIHDITFKLNADETLEILFGHVDGLLVKHTDKHIIGIGISVTGMLDVTRSVLISSSQLTSWSNIPIKSVFIERYELPVFVEDSAILNLLAEKNCADINGYDDIIYVQLGYGIGTGIMSAGRIVSGHQGLAGELGHSVIIPNGKLCTCGNYGCLRTVAASYEIISNYTAVIKMCGGNTSGITIHTIIEAAANNDKIAMNVIDESVRYIGIALANSINMLNPRLIIFGGQMFEESNYLLEPLKNVINRYILPQFTPSIRYKSAELIRYGGVIGAVIPVFDTFYNSVCV